MEQTPDQIAQSALGAFGKERQIDKCIEELGELTTALMKWKNGEAGADAVIDELADVAISGNTLCILFGKEAVDARVRVKLRRLVKLVADQVQANAEKVAQNPLRQPTPGKTLCVDCPHWDRIADTPEHGMCKHPAEPWFTPERVGVDKDWAILTDSEQSCLLPAPKPRVRMAELICDKWRPAHKPICNADSGGQFRCICGLAEEQAARDEALALCQEKPCES